jgi:hypothetical protein
MKLILALRLPCLTAFSLLLMGFVLSSCNLREDILLPPELDPKEYVLSNRIQVYSDHLISSENDDSFLYLPKTSISDSLIWYGDEISFSQVENLLSRDSLALAEGSTSLSNSYRIQVKRSGEYISLAHAESFATIYTDLSRSISQSSATLISWEYLLSAEEVNIHTYNKRRAFFEINGTGDFALAELSDSMELVIEESDTQVQGLLKTAETWMQIFVPAEFTQEMGQSVIKLTDTLESDQLQNVQELFPGFALLTKVWQVSTENSGSSSHPPIIHYHLPAVKSASTQWLKLHNGRIDSWAEGEDTWIIQDGKLISFINGAASYFLLQPLSGQNSFRISLDGSYSQIFLQDLWLDLKELNAPGIDLEITPNPPIQDIMQDYFGLRPYLNQGQLRAYQIQFWSYPESLESLPGAEWLEFGFTAGSEDPASARLMRVYRDPDKDIISYKTHAAAYDDNHFTTSDSYVYTGISSSGIYLYGHITEHSSSQQIPCLKDELYLEMERTTLSYQDSNPPCTAIRLDYGALVPDGHPWLSDLPYSLSNKQSLLQIVSLGSSTDALPQGLFLQSRVSGNPQSLINFSAMLSYPKFIRYHRSNTLEHNSFLYADGTMSVSPACAGYLIAGSSLNEIGNIRDLAMYPKMIFDDFDLELYLNSEAMMPPSTLQIEQKTSLSDSHQVLQEQYDLSYLSSAYGFEMLDNPGFYEEFQPYIRIKHQSRNQDLLISESDQDYYRIYSYPEGDQADGWHFVNEAGHYAFVLPYDAEYAIMQDANEHNAIEISLDSVQESHLSLYQAQLTVPIAQIGTTLPLGSSISLHQLANLAPGVSSRSAYRVGITGPQNNPMLPDFFLQAIEEWPYIYIPIADYLPGEPLRVYYRSFAGLTRELQLVQSFGDNPENEYIMIGNCALAFIGNPGYFYVD